MGNFEDKLSLCAKCKVFSNACFELKATFPQKKGRRKKIRLEKLPCSKAIFRREPLLLKSADCTMSSLKTQCLSLPLVTANRIIGLACLDIKDTSSLLDMSLLQSMAHEIAALIASAKFDAEREKNVKKVEELEACVEAKERLSDLGNLSLMLAHELRSPLGVAKMCVRRLEKDLNETQRKDVAMITEQISLCSKRIKELLTLTPTDLYQADVEEARVFFEDFLTALLEKEFKLPENIILERKFDKNLPVIKAKEEQLRHIFVSLIENAVQAMPSGGKLNIKATDRGNGFVEVKITDSGIGMSEKVKKCIFEPFFSTKEDGTGLGLSMVLKNILELNGIVDVESKEGTGTTFKLKFLINTDNEKEVKHVKDKSSLG